MSIQIGDVYCLTFNRHENPKSKYHGDEWGTIIEWNGEHGIIELWNDKARIKVSINEYCQAV